jgi:hypothetical protein
MDGAGGGSVVGEMTGELGGPGGVRLRPPRHPVDPRARRWWTTRALLPVAPPVVVLAVLAALIAPARTWLLVALVVVVVCGAVYTVVMPRWRYRFHRWEATDDAVYAAEGWVFQQWRIAPMSRIQTVDSERGPLARAFGLAAVTVTTASSAGAIKIVGLDADTATDLAHRLTAATEATPGDAT